MGIPCQRLQIIALERLARRERDGVHDDVESVPTLAQRLERAMDLRIVRDIAFEDDIRVGLCRQPADAWTEAFVLTGERELGALSAHRTRDPPSDRAIAGYAEYESPLAFEKRHRQSIRTETRRVNCTASRSPPRFVQRVGFLSCRRPARWRPINRVARSPADSGAQIEGVFAGCTKSSRPGISGSFIESWFHRLRLAMETPNCREITHSESPRLTR